MLNISLSDASPGQRLARAVSTPTGTVLVQAGERLTADLIDGLRQKGIESVVVEGEDPAVPTLSVAEQLAALDERFTGHEQHPLMMELEQVIAEQIAPSANGTERAGEARASAVSRGSGRSPD